MTLRVQEAAGAMSGAAQLSLGARVANALAACGAYLGDAFWPSRLAVFYPYAPVPAGRALAWALALLAITALALARRRREPWLAVGWLWFVGMLVPTLGLVQVGLQARADRYAYLPLVGLAIAVAWEAVYLARPRPSHRRALAGVAGAALIALGVASARQVGHWRDAVSLHARAVEVVPANFLEHERLALALLERGSSVEAEYHYRRSAEIAPRRAEARVGLGDALARQGRVEEAIRAYREALALDAASPDAPARLAIALVQAGRPEEALEAARSAPSAARSAHPGGRDPLLDLAVARAHAALGDPRAAVAGYRSALQRSPELRAASSELAWVLATSAEPDVRRPDEAIELALALLAVGPSSAADLDALAAGYAAVGRFDLAAEKAAEALALADPRDRRRQAAMRARLDLYRAGRPFLVAAGDRLR